MSSPAKEARNAELRLRLGAKQERHRQRQEELSAVADDVAQLRSQLPSTPSHLFSPSRTPEQALREIDRSSLRRDLFGGPPSGLEVAAQVRTMLDPPPGTVVRPPWGHLTAPSTVVRAPVPEVQPSGEQIAHHVPATVEAPARTTHRAQSVAEDIAARVVGASPEQLLRMGRDLQREPSLRALVRNGALGSDDVALERLEELLKKLQKLRDAQAQRFRQDALVATTAGSSKTENGLRVWTGPTWVPTPVVV
eukprot:COSAG04_NODE_104_length_26097_cov_12.466074_15_plen_251_part_00